MSKSATPSGRLASLSLRTRILFGFGALLLMLLGATAVSSLLIDRIGSEFAAFRNVRASVPPSWRTTIC